MNAIVIVEKRCTGPCGLMLPLRDFPARNDRAFGARQARCRFCKAAADRERRAGPRKPRKEEYIGKVDTNLPATTLLEQLECVRLRRWARNAQPSPRFGVAMIGGGYVV